MKCRCCGAELKRNSRFCEFCGTQVTVQMQREQEYLNRAGCPMCGSANIFFNRERQGEVRGKNGVSVLHSTVGVCRDCGYTWGTAVQQMPQKSYTWLWVLGWLCFFPIPLTVLILRNKNLQPKTRYAIVAAMWLFFILVGMFGKKTETTSAYTSPTRSLKATTAEDEPTYKTEKVGESALKKTAEIELVAGTTGKYGKEIVMSAGTDLEEHLVVYYLPAGNYTVKNLGEKRAQVSVYEGFARNDETGYDDYTNVGDIVVLGVGGSGEINIPEGWFVEIHEPTHISLEAK